MKQILAATILALSASANGADVSDLPAEKPATATAFVVQCNHVVGVVITYPSGKVVRFDLKNMHGFKNASELLQYAATAQDTGIYSFGCTET